MQFQNSRKNDVLRLRPGESISINRAEDKSDSHYLECYNRVIFNGPKERLEDARRFKVKQSTAESNLPHHGCPSRHLR